MTTNPDYWEKQSITCTAGAGTFRVSFKGDYSPDIPYNIQQPAFEKILLNMRTFGNVTADYTSGTTFCTTGVTNPVNITFYSELGDQPLITGDVAKLVYPGFSNPVTNAGVITVREKQAGVKQDLECAGQGICNDNTGECECFRGYSSSDGDGRAGLRGDCGLFGTGFS